MHQERARVAAEEHDVDRLAAAQFSYISSYRPSEERSIVANVNSQINAAYVRLIRDQNAEEEASDARER